MQNPLFRFIRDLYNTSDFIPLHAPIFTGNESLYVQHTIESTYVSSVGAYVDQLEDSLANYCGVAGAVAVVNGTSALQVALYASGVGYGDLVITQSMTFVATCNAIHWLGASPVFVDISSISLGLCPDALKTFLDENCVVTARGCMHKQSGKMVKAVVPMHTFGHPVQMDELIAVCEQWDIAIIEDAAESLGSLYKGKCCGSLGTKYAALSFNGNKILTTGGGGMVLCKEKSAARYLKHITTTAKIPHSFEFEHDEYGFNFRMPNLNAALGCAQFEQLENFIVDKRVIASSYQEYFDGSDFKFIREPDYSRSNYWLNAVLCPSESARNKLLNESVEAKVMLRAVWKPMHQLEIYKGCIKGNLEKTDYYAKRLVNLPSSVRGN
ncbi:LegC family aminotransferase [Bowmanella yangjiangensis]|uniref:LegC family aminotransferase n=1 Tax=Bowmanella yangjiangensis TaxID=2811230 RepID=A0ABS3CQN7_9ALTE|nr:LegC family aminotransferase [Bowmanella yangjiangensis]MBN7818864.1 LegC family aminotransferase [Bowmanella yangjiangensis]